MSRNILILQARIGKTSTTAIDVQLTSQVVQWLVRASAPSFPAPRSGTIWWALSGRLRAQLVFRCKTCCSCSRSRRWDIRPRAPTSVTKGTRSKMSASLGFNAIEFLTVLHFDYYTVHQ